MKNKKRLLSFLLIFALLFSSLPAQALAATSANTTANVKATTFSDVSKNDWFSDAVDFVRQNGIFNGTSENTFSPYEGMTRAMFVATLGRFAGVDVSDYSGNGGFADVNASAYYAPYVVWAVEKKITNGVGNQMFDPNGLITREQMAVFADNFFKAYNVDLPGATGSTKKTPSDNNSVASWASGAVERLYGAGVFQGDQNGNFNPQATATRAETATLYTNIYNKVPSASGVAGSNNTGKSPEALPNENNASAGSSSGGSGKYTITFVTNGGRALEPVKVTKDQVPPALPSPMKDGYSFLGWYTQSDLDPASKFDETQPVTSDLTLYAKYTDTQLNFTQAMTSHLNLNEVAAPEPVTSGYAIKITTTDSSLTAEKVRELIKFESLNSMDDRMVSVTGQNGTFMVSMEDGFTPGGDYRITLDDAGVLKFADREESANSFAFSVDGEKTTNLSLKKGILYIPTKYVSDIEKDGTPVTSMSIALYDFDEEGNGSSESVNGIFKYSGAENLEKDDILCIHSGVKPTATNSALTRFDEISYVKVTSVSGREVGFTNVEAKDVFPIGDTLPIYKNDVTDFGAANEEFTFKIEKTKLDFSNYKELGIENRNTVEEDDYIALYTNPNFSAASESDVILGRVTSATESSGIYTVTCDLTSVEQVRAQMSYFAQSELDSSKLLGDKKSVGAIKEDLKKQTLESGIIEELANNYALATLESDLLSGDLGDSSDIKVLMSDGKYLKADDLSKVLGTYGAGESDEKKDKVKPTDTKVTITLKNGGGTLGSNAIVAQIKLDFNITFKNKEGDAIKITFSVKFTQELVISVDEYSDIDVTWYFIIPVFDRAIVGADLTFKTYTGVNLSASLTTVSADSKNTIDVTEKIKGVVGKESDESVVSEVSGIYKIYQDFLKNDLDYVNVVEKQLFEKKIPVLLGLIQIRVEVNFLVSVAANATVGCELSYQEGKKFSFRVDLLNLDASFNTYTILDKVFSIDLYVIGNMGIRMGISPSVKVGVFTTKLANAGLITEVGVYIEFYGFFSYNYSYNFTKNIHNNDAKGAMYSEFGVYFTAAGQLEALGGKKKKIFSFVDDTWPILTTESQNYIYNFAYEEDKDTTVLNASNTTIPKDFFKMIELDLKDGKSRHKEHARNEFNIYFSNPAFSESNGQITVNPALDPNPNASSDYWDTEMTIEWISTGLAFTKIPIKRKIKLAYTTGNDLTVKHLLTVSANDEVLWSERVVENSNLAASLPTEAEILEMVNYERYAETVDGTKLNLKYLNGPYSYNESTSGNVTQSMDFTFKLPLREYELNVDGVQLDNGSTKTQTYKAYFGKAFDLSDIANTGTNIIGTGPNFADAEYTKFLRVETQKDNKAAGVQPNLPINDGFAMQLLSNDGKAYKYNALYGDNSSTLTYKFIARDIEISSQAIKYKKDTLPNPAYDYNAYVKSKDYEVYSVKGSTDGPMNQSREVVVTCVPKGGYALIYHMPKDATFTAQQPVTYSAIDGTILPTSAGVEKPNNIFIGWYDNAQFKGEPITVAKGDLGPLHLYGCFLSPAYKIEFNPNIGGKGTMDLFNTRFEEATSLPALGFSGDGYGNMTFIGWDTKPDGSGKRTYANEETIHEPEGINSSGVLKLYAQWDESIKVDYEPNTGLVSPKSGRINLSEAVEYSKTCGGTITLPGAAGGINIQKDITLHDGVTLTGAPSFNPNNGNATIGCTVNGNKTDNGIIIEEGSNVTMTSILVDCNINNSGTLIFENAIVGYKKGYNYPDARNNITNYQTGKMVIRNILIHNQGPTDDLWENCTISNEGTMVIDNCSMEYTEGISNEGTFVMNNVTMANCRNGIKSERGNLYILNTSICANSAGIVHSGESLYIVNSISTPQYNMFDPLPSFNDLTLNGEESDANVYYSTFTTDIPEIASKGGVLISSNPFNMSPKQVICEFINSSSYHMYIQRVMNEPFYNGTKTYLDYSNLDEIKIAFDNAGAYQNILNAEDESEMASKVITKYLGGKERPLDDNNIRGSYW